MGFDDSNVRSIAAEWRSPENLRRLEAAAREGYEIHGEQAERRERSAYWRGARNTALALVAINAVIQWIK